MQRFKVGSGTPYSGDSISTSSVAIKGTIGYIAPGNSYFHTTQLVSCTVIFELNNSIMQSTECAGTGEVSSVGDVYSFGIVLLEIFIRKRPTDDMFKDGVNIARFVEMNFPDRIAQIVDPELLEEHDDVSQQTSSAMTQKKLECLISVLNNGLRCANPSPNERMDMQEVAARLHGIKDAYLNGN